MTVHMAPNARAVAPAWQTLDRRLFARLGGGHAAQPMRLALACAWGRWSWMPLLALMTAVALRDGAAGLKGLAQCLAVAALVQLASKRLARRWSAQGLNATTRSTPEAVAAKLLAMQAQDDLAILWAVGVRANCSESSASIRIFSFCNRTSPLATSKASCANSFLRSSNTGECRALSLLTVSQSNPVSRCMAR